MSITITGDQSIRQATIGAPFFGNLPFTAGWSLRKPERAPFLVFVWLAVTAGVLAIFEPSPSDIGIALLFVAGFVTGNLHWGHRLMLPYMLLGLFVLSNLASLCYAIELASGAFYLAVTLFMLVSWLFIVGVLTRHEERGLRAVMFAFTTGGVVSALLAMLSYFNLAPLGEWVLFYDRIKGFFKDPNVRALPGNRRRLRLPTVAQRSTLATSSLAFVMPD